MRTKIALLFDLITFAFDGTEMYVADVDPRGHEDYTPETTVSETVDQPHIADFQSVWAAHSPSKKSIAFSHRLSMIGLSDLYAYCVAKNARHTFAHKPKIVVQIKKK